MTNNDILRRLRYTFDINDDGVIAIFKLGGLEVTRTEISSWLKKDDAEDYVQLCDKEFAYFLNGFIVKNRGVQEGKEPIIEKRLNNNILLRKFKIALDLKDLDMLEILELVGMIISKHELSAFFRKPSHKQFKRCKDQIIRNFLHGMQIKYHDYKK